jgi:hypothetical protein
MNTVDRSVEKLRTHLKRHRAYVATPAKSRNSEYHKRVSPIVRIGGRSNVSHNIATKAESITTERDDATRAALRLLKRASTDATTAARAVAMANIGNMFHPIIILLYFETLVKTTLKHQAIALPHP